MSRHVFHRMNFSLRRAMRYAFDVSTSLVNYVGT